jgi:hypothetical protein
MIPSASVGNFNIQILIKYFNFSIPFDNEGHEITGYYAWLK